METRNTTKGGKLTADQSRITLMLAKALADMLPTTYLTRAGLQAIGNHCGKVGWPHPQDWAKKLHAQCQALEQDLANFVSYLNHNARPDA